MAQNFSLIQKMLSYNNVKVNQTPAFYKKKEGVSTLYFFDNYNYFKIKGENLSKREIIWIAESFEMVLS